MVAEVASWQQLLVVGCGSHMLDGGSCVRIFHRPLLAVARSLDTRNVHKYRYRTTEKCGGWVGGARKKRLVIVMPIHHGDDARPTDDESECIVVYSIARLRLQRLYILLTCYSIVVMLMSLLRRV